MSGLCWDTSCCGGGWRLEVQKASDVWGKPNNEADDTDRENSLQEIQYKYNWMFIWTAKETFSVCFCRISSSSSSGVSAIQTWQRSQISVFKLQLNACDLKLLCYCVRHEAQDDIRTTLAFSTLSSVPPWGRRWICVEIVTWTVLQIVNVIVISTSVKIKLHFRFRLNKDNNVSLCWWHSPFISLCFFKCCFNVLYIYCIWS